MNRRRFLSFLGLAPVAAAVPAMALPRAEKPHEVRSAGFFMDVEAGEHKARIGATVSAPIDVDALNRDLAASFKWTSDSFRHITGELERLGRY
ncbi:hypothetical protein D7027_13140 [Ochrobactrum intermedium]|uniref:hypothetical protein n=1 Tax=Brucella intermedia TaxID=94625 RepID=UPI00128BEFC0|nr:hypothetical protein [Brucella intermedia]MPR62749.1 hypothetical protein [Brucella intermedia]